MKLSGSYQINLEKQKVWEALVTLENFEGGTKLTYTVEANVGGKIAQVGSRLIDMTAKKMTDIFFGKFSELISTKSELEKTAIPSEVAISREKKTKNKLFIIVSAVIVLGIAIYYLN